jgi:hypothetical protein
MMERRANDFYPTDPAHVAMLMRWMHITGLVYEPCTGDGGIARNLSGCIVRTNDTDLARNADTHQDARDLVYEPGSWVVTNPPFSVAFPILTNAHRQGCRIALLLRLSFLEPVQDVGSRKSGRSNSGNSGHPLKGARHARKRS